MKQLFLFMILVLSALHSSAQTGTISLFTETGERFQLVVDGELQNEVPQTNVKVQGLSKQAVSCQIIFENKTLIGIDKTIYIEQGMEAVYSIKLDKKGKYKVMFLGTESIENNPSPTPSN